MNPPTFSEWLRATGRDPAALSVAQKQALIPQYYAARGTLPDVPPPDDEPPFTVQGLLERLATTGKVVAIGAAIVTVIWGLSVVAKLRGAA